MRLLFITQKIDKDDDILGVYHRWIEELAKRVEKISVICLYRGRVELPDNVRVYSLGKEKLEIRNWKLKIIKKLIYAINFLKYIWRLRKDYDRVLVHMNPEYMILGAKLWKLLGKKIFFWYNHPMGGLRARVAIALADKVLHTSPFAFAARFKKAKQMPVGIDANLFRKLPAIQKLPKSILYLGRLSPIKFIEVLIDAALMLDTQVVDFRLTIAGEPSKDSEVAYAASLKTRAEPLVKKGKIVFRNAVPNHKASELYNSHEICVNMTPTGSFDKTIIEAMACEMLVVASNKAVADILPEPLRFQEKDAKDLARALGVALAMSNQEKQQMGARLREYVLGRHDLNTLIEKLVGALK